MDVTQSFGPDSPEGEDTKGEKGYEEVERMIPSSKHGVKSNFLRVETGPHPSWWRWKAVLHVATMNATNNDGGASQGTCLEVDNSRNALWVRQASSDQTPRLVSVPPLGGTFPRSDPSPSRRGVARRTHAASPRGALHLELAQGFQNCQ